MRDEPLVSIITPSYNQGQFIEDTILSVLNQTYKKIQYIIVDGGSTDNTMCVVNKYKDKIDIIINEKDKGQSDAINKGFKLAKGKLAGWIGSDDLLYPKCVENIIELYNINSSGSIYYNSNCDFINENGNVFTVYSKKIISHNYLLKKDYYVLQQGSFYPIELLKKINFLDESIHYCMDLDLWLKLSKEAPIIFSDKPPLSAFRIWDGTKTNTGNEKFLKEIRSVLLRHGARWYSYTVIKTYKSMIKYYLKKIILKVI